MTPDIVTSSNDAIDQAYGGLARQTWQWPARVYTDSELDQDPVWREWRGQARPRETARLEHTTVRFSYKVQAQIRHYRSRSDKYMIWLDTDVRQTRPVTPGEWLALMPWGTESITFLDRQPHKYAETGWVAYRRDPVTDHFMRELEAWYLDHRLWSLAQWHDAYVWDHVRQLLSVPSRSLAPAMVQAVQDSNIWPRSELATWSEHHKGRRKLAIPRLVS
jgi:hypothetical protein